MKIAILGTGSVGRAHAAKLTELLHEVFMGTRDPGKTRAVTKPDAMGNAPFSAWYKDHANVKLVDFAEAAKSGEIVINALRGDSAVGVLKTLLDSLKDKTLIDISNPLDFSKGMPPSLFVCNTDSLGEQIQRALPKVRVVKTLNTLNAHLQVDPRQLANGDHHVFVCGNDATAKKEVARILRDWYGWKNSIDLGDITTARGVEMLLPLWLRLWGALQNPMFNVHIQIGQKTLIM